MRGPDFIGIGMSKCGTSWLDYVLRLHPGIAIPPVKEVHFFDDYHRLVLGGDPSRYFSKDPYARRRWRHYLKAQTRRAARYPSPRNWIWVARFLFGRRDHDWYCRLFDQRRDVVRGEITPDYAVLEPAAISGIRERFPDLKAILLLRDPVDRLWSHAKMELASRRRRSISEIGAGELREFLFHDEGVAKRVGYRRILEDWSSVFGEGLFVGLYDEIKAEPERLIQRVWQFLGVPPVSIPESAYREVVFQGPRDSMPDDLRAELAERYVPEVEFVADFLGLPALSERWSR